MSTAYFYLTGEGEQLARKLAASHPGDLYDKENFKTNLQEAFHRYDYLVCIMATGIVVRILRPSARPQNERPRSRCPRPARSVTPSACCPVTWAAPTIWQGKWLPSPAAKPSSPPATDVAGELSFDTFAKKHNMAIENIRELKHISGALLAGQKIRVITDKHYPDLISDAAAEAAGHSSASSNAAGKIQILTVQEAQELLEENHFSKEASQPQTNQRAAGDSSPAGSAQRPTVVIDEGFTFPAAPDFPVLYLRPRTICAGIGCKRNMDAASIEEALLTTLKKEGLNPLSLKCISTIPLKADEPGIQTTADHLNVPVTIISTADIEALDVLALGIQPSEFVAEQTGVLSVSTASAYLASGRGRILRDKEKFKGITVALCQSDGE